MALKSIKRRTVTSLADLDELETTISSSAEVTVQALARLLGSSAAIDALASLKFTEAGKDPLDPQRPLNIVEQLNQSFTYLASIAGARWLLVRHPECAPLVLNFGTESGLDIESTCGRFVAEVFAATNPKSNNKLRKDVAKVRKSPAEHRFVFFMSPVDATPVGDPGVTIVRLDHPALTALRSVRHNA